MDIIQRDIKYAIAKLKDKYPIIALTGTRQSGKTTILKHFLSDYRYVNLENLDVRNFAETDPNGFFKEYAENIILDEVQRVPHLFSYLQSIVDKSGIMGQFILSGSQNFHLMQNITQSLAGRVAILKLFPFDMQELSKAQQLPANYLSSIIKGFYPAIYDRDIDSKTFYSNYVQTYIQRDVSDLYAINNLSLFQRFLTLCASRTGQLLNISSLANECGISQPTAKSWLSVLENSYIIFLLQPYYKNYNKRVIKTPKLYFYDTGLVCYLLKINTIQQIETHSFKGNLFETLMVAEYVKRMYHKNDVDNIWFWRDSNGNEVDLIIEKSGQNEVVEIKATQTIMSNLFKNLNHYASLEDENIKKTLVYGGDDNQQRSTANVLSWKEFGK